VHRLRTCRHGRVAGARGRIAGKGRRLLRRVLASVALRTSIGSLRRSSPFNSNKSKA
jgi:hypothetical protein